MRVTAARLVAAPAYLLTTKHRRNNLQYMLRSCKSAAGLALALPCTDPLSACVVLLCISRQVNIQILHMPARVGTHIHAQQRTKICLLAQMTL
jgi:hypothetical protein